MKLVLRFRCDHCDRKRECYTELPSGRPDAEWWTIQTWCMHCQQTTYHSAPLVAWRTVARLVMGGRVA